MPPFRPILERLLDKVEYDAGCWIFTGAKCPLGYGRLNTGTVAGRRSAPAHRVTYSLLVGHVHPAMHLDHLCRNPSCVNPLHLEPVSHGENVRRGKAAGRRITHCNKGHEYTAENTYERSTGRRECRICWLARARVSNQRRKGVARA